LVQHRGKLGVFGLHQHAQRRAAIFDRRIDVGEDAAESRQGGRVAELDRKRGELAVESCVTFFREPLADLFPAGGSFDAAAPFQRFSERPAERDPGRSLLQLTERLDQDASASGDPMEAMRRTMYCGSGGTLAESASASARSRFTSANGSRGVPVEEGQVVVLRIFAVAREGLEDRPA
jgi:hypothetical protein